MQVECIKPFGNAGIGDLVEVPDGAAVDPVYWRSPEAASAAPGAPEAEAAAAPPAEAAPAPAHFPASALAHRPPAQEGASS